jgi:hypothetical protein
VVLDLMSLVTARHLYKAVTRPLRRFPDKTFEIPVSESEHREYAMLRMGRTPMKIMLWSIGIRIFWLCLNVYSVAYIVARVYIVVESFLDLAYLPEGVYNTPKWSNYLPHFGTG